MIAKAITQSPALLSICALLIAARVVRCAAAEQWPTLPTKNNKATIPAQEWLLRPGPRTVPIEIYYPGGELARVDSQTGIFLTLHNWGGTGEIGTAKPTVLADRYNVIAITVDYLQSSPTKNSKEPYDFGYLQALDALRALHFVYHGLQAAGVAFDSQRIFATGGSGGGNVTLMCNKLAPRTFACVVDMSGMAKLSDDIAFGLPGGSGLNAGYNRDSSSPNYLSADAQQLRLIGDSEHLQTMRSLGNSCKIVVAHGMEDATCPVKDAQEMVQNMKSAGMNVEAHFIDQAHLDGKIFTDTGHKLGNRTRILEHVADDYLLPNSSRAVRRTGKSDFDLRDDLVRFHTAGGQFVISYKDGFPVGRFE